MAEVLVLVEHSGGEVKKVSCELLTAAARLGEPAAVWTGPGVEQGRERLAEFGAARVYVADAGEYDEYVVAPKAELLARLVADKTPSVVLTASTAEGKEIAARLAVKTNSGVLTDVVDVTAGPDGTPVVEHANFGGAITVHARVVKGTPIIAVRPNAVSAVAAPGAAELVPVTVAASDMARAAKITDHVTAERGSRPDLTEAQIVVSGGRGTGSAEGFKIIEDLADALGAAVGASRAVTDAWHAVPGRPDRQDRLPPAVPGRRHLRRHPAPGRAAQTSKTIIAVNKDAEAPIFEIADLGIVGDLFTVVPQLIDEIGARKG